MLDEIFVTLREFVGLFRRDRSLPWTILLPLFLMAFSWPMLRVVLPTEREAFMTAFVLGMGLRLLMSGNETIDALRSRISGRTALIIILLLGPASLGVLIWAGEPVWCQRFLTVYFLIYAVLYVLDTVDGRHAMVRYFLPEERARGADALMSRVLALMYMSLALLNETLIHQASLEIWLLYFGVLPIFLRRLILAVMRTVDQAYAYGLGRF